MNEETDKEVAAGISWRKPLLLVCFLLSVIGGFTFDSRRKPCVLSETRNEKLIRLFCSTSFTKTLTADELNNFTSLVCTEALPATECEKDSACLEVAFDAVSSWIEDNPFLGYFLAALVYIISTILFLSGAVLTLSIAAAFSVALGSSSIGLVVLIGSSAIWIGAVIGATFSFILARYVFSSFAENLKRKYQVMSVLDTVTANEGLKVVLLLRLSPVVPFNAINYIFGGSSLTLQDFILGTAIGIIPGTSAYVFIGASIARTLTRQEGKVVDGELQLDSEVCDRGDEDTVTTIVLILGGIATVVAVLIISRFARKEWVKISKESQT